MQGHHGKEADLILLEEEKEEKEEKEKEDETDFAAASTKESVVISENFDVARV